MRVLRGADRPVLEFACSRSAGTGGPADEARSDIMVPGSAGVVTLVGMSGDRLELLRAGPAVPVPVQALGPGQDHLVAGAGQPEQAGLRSRRSAAGSTIYPLGRFRVMMRDRPAMLLYGPVRGASL